MFRSIGSKVTKRVEDLKNKTMDQENLENSIRSFLIQEFGDLGESLYFRVSRENKKLRLWFENKTAANEISLRSTKLSEYLKSKKLGFENLTVG